MDKYLTLCFLTFCIYSSKLSNAETTPPHIIVMLADDLGWNDVSFHGSNQIPTPNIDALAYNGIILNNHYVQPLCTPSRAAFLTGKYPIHTGMQHIVLLEPEPRGLPLNETLLPEHLKKAGYDTHIVGKWHLGYHRTEYTPTRRGFDSHYGYWNGLQDYYNHNVIATFQPEMDGYDMRRNLDVDYSAKGKYSTELFADEAVSIISGHNVSKPMFLFLSHLAPHTGNIPNPLQAPDEEIAKFDHIADPNRRVYAAMVSMLDQSVGNVMKALRSKGMLDNSIILFMSDNGAPTIGVHSNKGSNFPLKGQKDSPWEGGSRGVAAVWSPLFKNMNRVSHQLMHITDWLPTFWSAAGRDTKELGNIDGISMWNVLKDNEPSPRVGFVHNIDNLIPYVSIRHGEWKYINGTTSNGAYDDIRGESGENSIEYDLKSVMQSKTANVLAGFIAQRQMKEMANSHRNINVNYTLKALSANMVTSLRQEAKINCNPINATSDGANLQCNPLKSPCLFNIKDDPCEMVNLADVRPIILESMQKMVAKYQESTIPPSNVPIDPLANPAYHNNVWTSWKDEVTIKSIFDSFSRSAIISFGVLCAVFILAILIVLVATLRRHNCYDKTFNAASKNGRGILFRTFSTADRRDRRRSRSRDAAMSAPVSVARRVEQFEDKDILKGRGNSQI